eukprot:COSAG06_NODE_1106_length_10684_cov_5.383656_6_plen_46_part_00
MKFRLMPAIARLNQTVPSYENWHNVATGGIMFATLASSILGVIGE